MNLKKLIIFFIIVFLPTQILAKESNNHQFNFFTGNFDFSDDKQAAVLVGLQHQNESLKRDTIIGKISPITGGFITENSAVYIYTGFEWNVDMGALTFTPSFAPGLYHEGDGKDLGINLSYEVQESPDGLAQAFIIGEEFINGQPCVLILGDNLFFGNELQTMLHKTTSRNESGATVFAYPVRDPQRYGVVDFDEKDPFLYTDLYFNLKSKLEGLLKRQVDLLEERAIKNRFFRQQLESTKVPLYGN